MDKLEQFKALPLNVLKEPENVLFCVTYCGDRRHVTINSIYEIISALDFSCDLRLNRRDKSLCISLLSGLEWKQSFSADI